MDTQRQAAALRQPAVRSHRRPETRLEGKRAGIVDGHDTKGDELVSQGRDEPFVAILRRARDAVGDEPGGGLVEDAGRRAFVVAADEPARRIGRFAIDPGDLERRAAHPQRVMVVSPQGNPSARRDPIEIAGCRPAPPAIRVPAMTLDPVTLGQATIGRGDEGQPVVNASARLEIDLLEGDPAVGQVEVGVGQARNRHLVGVELVADRERVGPCLELDRRAGKGHPSVLDPDGLNPAEPGFARERGDPAGDEGIERHRLSSAVRRGGSPARAGRGPRPTREQGPPGPSDRRDGRSASPRPGPTSLPHRGTHRRQSPRRPGSAS